MLIVHRSATLLGHWSHRNHAEQSTEYGAEFNYDYEHRFAEHEHDYDHESQTEETPKPRDAPGRKW